MVKKQLFISWSGNIGKEIADLIYDWMDRMYEGIPSKVFFSTEIRPGTIGLNEILDALDCCDRGFFIITRERMNSPWIYFEAGAISKGNRDKRIVPIYVDVERDEIINAPLPSFQSNISFSFDNLFSLIQMTGNELGWTFNQSYTYNKMQSISEEFSRRIVELENTIKKDLVMKKVYQNCRRYESCYVCEEAGCIAHLDQNSFFAIRKAAVQEAKGEIIIAGPSLTEALGQSSRNNRSLRGILKDGIEKGRITTLHVLITDLSIFEQYFSESNEATARISGSLNALKNDLFCVCDQKACEINIYFLPLYQIDHVVLTNEYMLYRSTKLWTANADYKGEFILYRNAGEQSEYAVHRAYLKQLMKLCTKINFDIDTEKSNSDSYIARENKNWRNNIKNSRAYTSCENKPGELKYIHLYKLYNSQLAYYIACDWKGPNHSELRFTPGEFIKKPEDLYSVNNLLGDDTQTCLLPYIKETEKLLRGVVEKYGMAEIHGERISDAKIYPSLDLGFPNNAVRLAGGFATGMLVTWKCGTPIVPVDATVNVCSSSVFELPDSYSFEKSGDEFNSDIQILIHQANEAGYAFNFSSGNHFLMLAEDEKGKKYLVLHSSAKEFKDSFIGLYPTEENWYSEKIRTYPTPYVHGERYLRYLKGEEAAFFISLAKKLEKMNEQIHAYFADKFQAKKCRILSRPTFHHYYMPTDSSIAIGTFVEEPGTTVPIFSAPGKDVCLFRISNDQNWTIQLGGKPKCLVPHGWGQAIDGKIDLSVDYIEQEFVIQVDDKPYKHNLTSEKHLTCEKAHIREFESCNQFLESQKYVQGQIVKILRPKYLFCSTMKGKVES